MLTPARPWGRIVLVVVSVGALWAAAGLLTRAFHDGQARRAAVAAAAGLEARVAGRLVAAASHFREAAALQPDDLGHRLALAEVLVSQQQWLEAERYLLDVLRVEASSGPANLALARAYRGQGRRDEAEGRYYQAIYGRWPEAGVQARVDGRLELIDLLASAADHDRVRGELLQLAASFPEDLEVGLRAGRSLLDHGFPGDAARLYGELALRAPASAPVFAGLAEAELGRRRYAAAATAAQRALSLDPNDRASSERLQLASAVSALDPNEPRLSIGERARRTRRLLDLVRNRLDSCQPVPTLPRETQELLVDLGQPRAQAPSPAVLDGEMALLEAAARVVVEHCASLDASQPIDLVLQTIGEGPPP